MKLLTHTARRGVLTLPGIASLAAGGSVEVSDGVAAALARVTPPLPIEISEIEISRDDESQPEAQQGEGQSIATELQEE